MLTDVELEAAAVTMTISARYGPKDAWFAPDWPDKPALGPYPQLPDGRDPIEATADGDMGLLPHPVVLRQSNRGNRFGDILWTEGTPIKAVSQRLVDALTDVGATGWRTFPIEVIGADGDELEGYLGLATIGSDPSDDLRHTAGAQNFAVTVSDRVLDALSQHGVDGLLVEPL